MISKIQPTVFKTHKRLAVVACSAAIAASVQSIPSLAQSELALEEVIVTATRRDESLQDVAVSVSAIDAELGQATVRRLDDLQTFSPNLYIRRSPGIGSGASITIRGIGTQDVDKTLDPAIGVMMDGVFLGTSSGVLMQNFDVQRIEVLRGPQGTLFGKNTTGGLINIVRGDVTMEWGGDFIVTLDEHGREDVKGVVNVPIAEDKLGIKLFGAQVKSDGYMYNTTLDEDVGGDDVQNYGFAAKWQPTDNFDIKLHYEKTKDESDQGAYVNRNTNNDNTCKFFGQCVYTTTDNENQNSSETRNFSDNEYDTTILTANYDFGNMVLTYIGATRDMEEQNMQSFDASPAAFLDMNYFNFWDQESHELRLTSNFDGPINFVAGLYSFEVDYEQYWDVSHLHFTYNQILGFPLFPDVTAPTSVKTQGQRQQTDSWAAFFSADWAISDRLTLTVGGRYTEEEKDFSGDNGSIGWNPAAGEARPTDQSTVEYDADWSEFTPSASLRFNMTDNTMLWASYAEGFKSGGFFGRQANFEAIDVSFEPEFLTNMEVGFKSTLLDGAMTLNASYFFSDYDDKQVSVLVARGPADVATVVNNIDSQEISGLEVDLSWQITQNWFVRANYGYLDAEYNEFYGDLNGDGVETENSFMQPRNTPENTFGISTVYTAAFGPGNLQGVLAYRYRDAIQTDLVSQSPTTPPSPTNTGGIGAMGSIYDVSAQMSYMFSDDRYRITVYGKNLTDERELFNQTIGGIATRGYWNDPRTLGVEFAVSF
ncbi:MAG: TonB-dependent receptor [Luminiphilus sp.]|nr:TonB-dependent receptor [Luminiphilus sp.]